MSKRNVIVLSQIIFFILIAMGNALAAVPQSINYQGNLTDSSSGAAINGSVDMVFSIYDVDSGGTALWTETQTSVAVSNGLFSVTLGAVTPIDLTFDAQYFLGVKVGTDDEMTPRQALTSVGYAFMAESADTAATVSGTVGIANGGTGATTASAARTALGAAASGANSDITSLSGLTSALSVTQGGTGATTASAARTALGVAVSGANSDITSLSGLSTAISIGQGGTGATTASVAINNLLPSQSGNSGKFLTTDGSTASWGTPSGGSSFSSAAVVTNTSSTSGWGPYSVTATCAGGRYATGGGCQSHDPGSDVLSSSYPTSGTPPTAWRCDWWAGGNNLDLTAYVICMP